MQRKQRERESEREMERDVDTESVDTRDGKQPDEQ